MEWYTAFSLLMATFFVFVLLGIPAYRPDQANFATNGGALGDPTTRYAAEPSVTRDDMTGRRA